MKIIDRLFIAAIIINVMVGSMAWFTWEIHSIKILQMSFLVLTAIISYLYMNMNGIILAKNPKIIAAFVMYFLAVIASHPSGFMFIFGTVCRLFPYWVLISDNRNSNSILKALSTTLAVIIVPGLFVYIILFFANLPSIPLFKGDVLYLNYIFLIQNSIQVYLNNSIRFQSVFLEPGYLGTLLTFLLYAENYNFKKNRVKIMLIGLVVSFSLAGYLMSIVGYIYSRGISGRNHSKLIVGICIIVACFVFGKNYNSGNNPLNELIIERLMPDDDKGFNGNNRSTVTTDFYFEKYCKSGDILTGIGSEQVEKINGFVDDSNYQASIAGAGYKVYFITYGIISFIFYMLFYYCVGNSQGGGTRYWKGAFLIILLAFMVEGYPDSSDWIITYILGINSNSFRNL